MATEMLKQLDLSQGPLGQDLLAEDIGDLLDGDALAGLDVGCGTWYYQHVYLQSPVFSVQCPPRLMSGIPTTRYRRLPGPAPWSHCIARSR